MLPSITIDFKEAAESAIARSKKGILCIVIAEASVTKVETITSVSQIEKTSYTTTNKADITRAFDGTAPKKVVVVPLKSAATQAQVTAALDEVCFDWVVTNAKANFQTKIIEYIKVYNQNENHARRVNAVVIGLEETATATTASSSSSSTTTTEIEEQNHIVNVAEQLYYNSKGTLVNCDNYLVRIAAEICACPITQSVTYLALSDLARVGAVDEDTEDGNNVYLCRDDDVVRISTGIMMDGTKIALQAVQDMVREDVSVEFKNHYLGKVRNSPDNQQNFCAAVLGYLKDLATQGVVNPEQEITADIDVDAQREQWEGAGTDTSDMDDAAIRNKPYKSYVFLKVVCSILDVMEDTVIEVILQ